MMIENHSMTPRIASEHTELKGKTLLMEKKSLYKKITIKLFTERYGKPTTLEKLY